MLFEAKTIPDLHRHRQGREQGHPTEVVTLLLASPLQTPLNEAQSCGSGIDQSLHRFERRRAWGTLLRRQMAPEGAHRVAEHPLNVLLVTFARQRADRRIQKGGRPGKHLLIHLFLGDKKLLSSHGIEWPQRVFGVSPVGQQRVVGALSKGGKEGHLTEREATAKVIRVMQQDMSSDVAKAIAAHVYGETELPAQAIRPAGCPRAGQLPKPATATH